MSEQEYKEKIIQLLDEMDVKMLRNTLMIVEAMIEGDKNDKQRRA